MKDKFDRPAVCAEIGVQFGHYSAEILEICKPSQLILVDPWKSLNWMYVGVQERFKKEIKKSKVEIIRKMSHLAAKIFEDETFDWVYIDAKHDKPNVARDLNSWAPKVEPGGWILGHDYMEVKDAQGVEYGVIEAVADFVAKNPQYKFAGISGEAEHCSFGLWKEPDEGEAA